MNSRLAMTLLVASGIALSACAKKAPEMLPPDPGGVTPSQTTGGDSTAPVPGSQADFVAQMMGQDTIYFDTDRFNIDATDQAALAAQAAWLGRYPAKRITIEGHADERGTREYNPPWVNAAPMRPRTIWSAWGSTRAGSPRSATARKSRSPWVPTKPAGRRTAAR